MTHRLPDIGYTVADIATPIAELSCWEGGQARAEIAQYAVRHNLTYIPLKEAGRITGIITRDALVNGAEPWHLTSDWLIASDTPILELIQLFAEKSDRVFLMLQASRVCGLVAPADLNKIPARATVYLLIAQFEAELARLIRTMLPRDEDMQACLSDDRWQKLMEEKTRAAEKDIEMDLLHYMHIYDLVLIARQNDGVRQLLGFETTSQARKALDFQGLRNRVSHPARPLITARSELAKLAETCRRLVELNQRIEQARHQS